LFSNYLPVSSLLTRPQFACVIVAVFVCSSSQKNWIPLMWSTLCLPLWLWSSCCLQFTIHRPGNQILQELASPHQGIRALICLLWLHKNLSLMTNFVICVRSLQRAIVLFHAVLAHVYNIQHAFMVLERTQAIEFGKQQKF
jgi:hypothetical protein